MFSSNALSFYRSQNVLWWSKFFEPAQKFIYILCQSQTFCARQKDDLHSVKLFFVPAQNILGPVKGHGIKVFLYIVILFNVVNFSLN